jgi:hypothetical protein
MAQVMCCCAIKTSSWYTRFRSLLELPPHAIDASGREVELEVR